MTSWQKCIALFVMALLFLYILFMLSERVTSLHQGTLRQVIKSHSSTLVWIPTTEGISSRYFQTEVVFRHLRMRNRSLTIVNIPSTHSGDVGMVNMCKIFVFPKNIRCSDVNVVHLLATRRCVSIGNDHIDRYYNNLLKPSASFSWDNSSCAALVGYQLPPDLLHVSAGQSFPVKFQTFYRSLRDIALARLFGLDVTETARWGGKLPAQKNLIAIHWRRGDQSKYRCHKGETGDSSFNCGGIDSLVNFVNSSGLTLPWNTTGAVYPILSEHEKRNKLAMTLKQQAKRYAIKSMRGADRGVNNDNNSTQVVYYVATNEESPLIYAELHSMGFWTQRAVNMRVNTIEQFVVEVQIMALADRFIYDGISGVHDLVNLIRDKAGT